jgi:hypothetical protein
MIENITQSRRKEVIVFVNESDGCLGELRIRARTGKQGENGFMEKTSAPLEINEADDRSYEIEEIVRTITVDDHPANDDMDSRPANWKISVNCLKNF